MRERAVAVVGGGVTGLSATHRVHELGGEALLLEREARCGGVVLTEREGAWVVEAGPDSFLARKPWASELCRRLGLGDELIPADARNRGSFVWLGGRLHPLPEGLTSLVPTRLGPLVRSSLLSPAGKARLLLEPFVPRGPAALGQDESLAGFFRRRLGEQASRRLVEPLARGIYGGDPESLSLRATFPRLARIERRHGSLVRGLLRESRAGAPPAGETPGGAPPGGGALAAAPVAAAGFLSLRRGMGALVERLLERLPRAAVRTSRAVERLERAPDGAWELRVREPDGGRTVLRAAAVVLATPAAEAARLIGRLDPELSGLLAAIRSGSSVTVSLGWDRARVAHPLIGHGFVVPEEVGGPLLACTWASSKFPGRAAEGRVLLRAFMADPERLLALDDRAVAGAAGEALRPILGLEGPPERASVHRWPAALPRYELGHPQRVDGSELALARHPGLFLAGAAYRGLGVPDCVRGGEEAAERALRHVATGATRPRPGAAAEGPPGSTASPCPGRGAAAAAPVART